MFSFNDGETLQKHPVKELDVLLKQLEQQQIRNYLAIYLSNCFRSLYPFWGFNDMGRVEKEEFKKIKMEKVGFWQGKN